MAKAQVHSWIERVWYEGAASGLWLIPLGWIFGALAALRRALYRSGMLSSYAVSAPVIVVGNVTAGGTGKTPLVIWLVEELARLGFKPGVVSCGYGGSLVGPALVTPSLSAAQCGDEALLIAARTHRTVVVARDRVAGAKLVVECGANVVVADDGLQHYRLRRQCEIVVLDGRRRVGNGRFIPAGPLRETLRRLDLADAIVVNGGTARPGEIAMRLVGTRARNLRDGSDRALASFAGTRLHAVAGIGNPQRFFASLADEGLTVIEHAFPDHHAFQPGDLDFGDALPVLMTEKDAVKCRAFPRESWWVVPVGAHIDGAAAGTLMTRIAAAIRGSSLK